MENNQTYYQGLITRYFSGEANAEEIQVISDWIKSDIENKNEFNRIQEAWLNIEKFKIDSSINVDDEWTIFKSKVNFNESKINKETIEVSMVSVSKSNYNYIRIAAILLLIATISTFLYLHFNNVNEKIVVAQLNSQENILPDGSKVTLNAGASLEYPCKFNKAKRVVKLKGEAYFNVKHDEKKPFVIKVDDIKIEVLGTSFYVNTNKDGKVEVILTNGKVAIYYKNDTSKKQILSPGEKADASKNKEEIVKVENVDKNYMAFKTKEIVFDNTPIEEAVRILNNVYHSNIIIKYNKMPNVSGVYHYQTLDSVLTVMKDANVFKVKKSSSSIEISGNECK